MPQHARDVSGSAERTEVVGMLWIVIIAVVVAALAVYAFWPRKGGVRDNNIREAKFHDRAKGDGIGGGDG